MHQFDRVSMPPPSDPRWKEFRKMHPTRMVRIDGPFRVVTLHGPVECDDGYLAVDSGGWPYPVHKFEFDRMYEPA